METTQTVEVTAEAEQETSIRDDLQAAMSGEAEEVLAVSEEDEVVSHAEDSEGGDSVEAIAPPEHWPEEEKTEFGTYAPDVQSFVLAKYKAMEKAHQERSQALAEDRKNLERYKRMDELMAPYSQELQLSGTDPVDFVGSLVAAHNYLQQDPQKALQWLAQRYGVEAPTETLAEDYQDPAVTQMQQQIQEVARNQQQQAVQQAARQIQDFIAEKDDDNNLVHPYWDEVESLVTKTVKMQVASGETPDLKSAYEAAVWQNPATREKMLSSKAEKEQAAAEEERIRKAEQAKRSATKVKSSSGSESEPAKSLRDELRAGLRKAS